MKLINQFIDKSPALLLLQQNRKYHNFPICIYKKEVTQIFTFYRPVECPVCEECGGYNYPKPIIPFNSR